MNLVTMIAIAWALVATSFWIEDGHLRREHRRRAEEADWRKFVIEMRRLEDEDHDRRGNA